MKITTVTATYGRKFNLGSYNSLHIELTAVGELEDGDDAIACEARLLTDLAEQVKAKALPVLRGNLEEIAAVLAGLPPEVREQLVKGV